jgi:hypothetical protein
MSSGLMCFMMLMLAWRSDTIMETYDSNFENRSYGVSTPTF